MSLTTERTNACSGDRSVRFVQYILSTNVGRSKLVSTMRMLISGKNIFAKRRGTTETQDDVATTNGRSASDETRTAGRFCSDNSCAISRTPGASSARREITCGTSVTSPVPRTNEPSATNRSNAVGS